MTYHCPHCGCITSLDPDMPDCSWCGRFIKIKDKETDDVVAAYNAVSRKLSDIFEAELNKPEYACTKDMQFYAERRKKR